MELIIISSLAVLGLVIAAIILGCKLQHADKQADKDELKKWIIVCGVAAGVGGFIIWLAVYDYKVIRDLESRL